MNNESEKCTYCIYFNRKNNYCSCLEAYIDDIREAAECYTYHDSLSLRVQDKYKDDDEDLFDDNEGQY